MIIDNIMQPPPHVGMLLGRSLKSQDHTDVPATVDEDFSIGYNAKPKRNCEPKLASQIHHGQKAPFSHSLTKSPPWLDESMEPQYHETEPIRDSMALNEGVITESGNGIPELQPNELIDPFKIMELELTQRSLQTKQPVMIVSTAVIRRGECLPQGCPPNLNFTEKDEQDHDSCPRADPVTWPRHKVTVQDCYENSSGPVNLPLPVDGISTCTHHCKIPNMIQGNTSTCPDP
jgi:hypothetical protein